MLPALVGRVPDDMVKAIRSFMDFCYIARRNAIDENAIEELHHLLAEFYQFRKIFVDVGVRTKEQGISLPRQHSLKHYIELILLFACPNGHCSSITECKHSKAVKDAWRRSSKFKALGQMLLTNQRQNKLSRARQYFESHGMMDDDVIRHLRRAVVENPASNPLDDENIVGKVVLAQTKGSFLLYLDVGYALDCFV